MNRLKKYQPALQCSITITDSLALEQAKRADEEIKEGKYRGILHGIPYGTKDLMSVPGYPTTWGATPYKDQIIDETATVVKKLEDAGAILVTKLVSGALARGDVWFDGKTKIPGIPPKVPVVLRLDRVLRHRQDLFLLLWERKLWAPSLLQVPEMGLRGSVQHTVE